MELATAPKKTLGNYTDFRSGNIKNKEFVFVLNHINQKPSYTSSRGQGMHYPPSFRLVLVDSVYDEDKKMMREIRYIPGELSLYKDEQTQDDRVVKANYFAEFVNGEYIIQGSDTLKLKFFMITNSNGTNPKRDKDKNIRFFMLDPGEGLKSVMDTDELMTEAQHFCYKGDWDEVAAYAMVQGLSLDRDAREIRYSLRMIATNDPKKFMDGLKSPKMKRKYFVMEALREGVIVRNNTNNSISWKGGNAITQSPIGKDLIDDFVDATFTPAGETVYNTLIGLIRPEKVPTPIKTELNGSELPKTQAEQMKKDLTPSVPAQITLSNETEAELVALVKNGVEKGVIVINLPFWYKYKGQSYKKEEGVVNELRINAALLAALKADLETNLA